MKIGIRKPSIKKSISARTTGKVKRKLKRLTNPFYGKKGMGWIKNPGKALKGKLYRKSTISAKQGMGCLVACIWYPIYFSFLLAYWCLVLMWWMIKYSVLGIWYLGVLVVNGIIAIVEAIINRGAVDEVDGTVVDMNERTKAISITSDFAKTTPMEKPENEKNYELFDDIDEENKAYLAYSYEENLAFTDCEALSGHGGETLTFEQERDNEYDSKAIAVYLEDKKVGYLYKGTVQDMVNDWIRRGDYFWGYVNKIDKESSKATIKIGFYKDMNKLCVKKYRLTRITKKKDEFGNSRYDNMANMSDGDIVEYTESYDSEKFIITNEYGDEIGEINEKAAEILSEDNVKVVIARINDIEETDSGSYKASVEFYYQEC